MGTIRVPGKINSCTTLIDIGMRGLAGVTAVYLIRGSERTCLVDSGTRAEAHRIVQALETTGSFPPDLIVLTHAHHDHAQGVPILQREAAKKGRSIEVLASWRSIPLLEDATYNEIFDNGPYESISPVSPLQDADTIDLGGVRLWIYDVPGHSEEHIAILDEHNRNLFVGDAIGLKVSDDLYLPPFIPPSWDPVAFQRSIQKLGEIGYRSLCLAHFGCVCGQDADDILYEALEKTEAWWRLFEDNTSLRSTASEAVLDEPDALFHAVVETLQLRIPDLKRIVPDAGVVGSQSPAEAQHPEGYRGLLRLDRFPSDTAEYRFRSGVSRDKCGSAGEVFLRGFVAKLAQGYRTYRNRCLGQG